MISKKIIAIVLKILGVFMIAKGLNFVFSFLILLAVSSNGQPLISYGPLILPNCSYFLVGFLLWILSGRIASWLTKDEQASEATVNTNLQGLAKLGFALLGLFLIGESLPKVLSILVALLTIPDYPSMIIGSMTISNVTTPFFSLLIGIGIFLGAEGLTKAFKIFRNLGLKESEETAKE